ncbi:class III lanthionine synthetase LanKC [Streptomyces sp. NPDC093544]|uniref:class III lanthionine synthetase LanKC n=1 Tax=Streptomyces sp. NPDC093544 TaxID=3155200 RepID=UPI00342F52CC
MLTLKDYDRFCLADPVFYELPERFPDEHDRLAPALRRPPKGWERIEADWWVRLRPLSAALPEQGWQVHVSVTADEVEKAAEIVWGYCVERKLPFQVIRSLATAREVNDAHADRFGSGRLCTVRAADEATLDTVLRELGVLLDAMAGPYVLGALRHGPGPLYVDYGSYGELSCPDAAGERVPAVRRPDGVLEPRPPRAMFTLPEWVEPPAVLAADLRELHAKPAGEFPYRVERALGFGNGGGIYHATDSTTGEAVILHEAREHAGLDRRGADAVARLQVQRSALTALAGLPWVPRLIREVPLGEHRFLAVERIPGESLKSKSLRFPLTTAEQSVREAPGYTAWALGVAEQIDTALSEALARGVCFKALDPAQVLERPDGSIAVVGFASVTDPHDDRPSALAEEEFAVPAGLCGPDAHRYLADCLRLWLFLPLPHPQLTKVHTLTRAVGHHFPVPAGFGAAVREGLRPAGGASPQEDPAATLLAAEYHDWPAIRDSLVAGLHACATPDRADRLFPGSPTWHKTLGGYAFDYGAAGVLYALHRAGAEVPAEYVDWLVAAAERDADPRPGLYDGLHGVAHALDVLGHRDQALEVLDRCRKTFAQAPDGHPADLAAGTAGIALGLLHFAPRTSDDSLREVALRLAEDLAGLVRRGPLTARPGDPPPVGLLHGATGPALLFLHLHRETGESRWLDLAAVALRHDLDRCRPGPDGTVMLNDGIVGLPYLHGGSMGLAFALREYLRHRPDAPEADTLAAIRRTCEPVYVRNGGLLRGRAGAIATLVALGDPPAAPAIRTQIRRLGWHAQLYGGHLAFPGFRLHRLSADLATGSAGVLLALNSALGQGGSTLPFLEPRHLSPPAQRR